MTQDNKPERTMSNEEIAKECAFYKDDRNGLTQQHSLASTIVNVKEALDAKDSEIVRLKERVNHLEIYERLNNQKSLDYLHDEYLKRLGEKEKVIAELNRKLSLAVEALKKIAKPALGGKQQQWTAQEALQQIKGE